MSSGATPGNFVLIDNPNHNGTECFYFFIRIRGNVSVFNPLESYWGTAKPILKRYGFTYAVPIGMHYSVDVEFTWSNPIVQENYTRFREKRLAFQNGKQDEKKCNFTVLVKGDSQSCTVWSKMASR